MEVRFQCSCGDAGDGYAITAIKIERNELVAGLLVSLLPFDSPINRFLNAKYSFSHFESPSCPHDYLWWH